jgi:hypothetical protein
MTRLAAAALLLAVLVGGCSQKGATPGPSDAASTPTDRYVALAETLHQRSVQIWWETDLVARWLEGKAAFDNAVARLGTLAQQPGTAGIKIADELGYDDDIHSPEQATRFLTAARQALAAKAPGKQLLVDVVVPELGCLPWRDADGRACAAEAMQKDPAASVATITGYLRAKLVDRLDLSTGLLDEPTYTNRGLTRLQAQTEAWQHVSQLGWPRMTVLQARKALAAADGYRGSDSDAAADVALYVDTPVAAGAEAVDIWTWRQRYSGQTVSLLAGDLTPNPLWRALTREHDQGVQLITHMTPSTMPADTTTAGRECDLVASVFTAVFVAAGTG